MIVGVLDTGFWPENPSFAPLPEPRPDAAVIAAKWHGTCDAGSDPDPANRVTCNNKVIGARWFDDGGLSDSVPDEFLSPRDRNSHGSHTASTAAGNNGPTACVNGASYGTVSGMAPAARLAIYKIGWHQPDGTASGSTEDIAAAIDQATADGVDVINLSFSGSRTFVVDPVELAFLFAADAGVFAATSAGNTARARARSPTTRRGSPRSRRARTTALLHPHGDARQRHHVQRSGRGSGGAIHGAGLRRRRRIARCAGRDGAAVPQRRPERGDARRTAGARPGQGRRQDRRLRPRRQRPHGQEHRRAAGRRRRHDPHEPVAELAQRRLPRRPDDPRRTRRCGPRSSRTSRPRARRRRRACRRRPRSR